MRHWGKIAIRPIGFVRNNFEREYGKAQWQEAISAIEILPKFRVCLQGIELCRYIMVIFWMDRADKKRCHANGAFATCLPERPNSIGVTFVELVDVQNGILRVRGLDALNNTPVLDIKPYKPWSINRIGGLPDINLPKPGE